MNKLTADSFSSLKRGDRILSADGELLAEVEQELDSNQFGGSTFRLRTYFAGDGLAPASPGLLDVTWHAEYWVVNADDNQPVAQLNLDNNVIEKALAAEA